MTDGGWSGLENGELLRAAAGQFDIEYQQNLRELPMAVVVLVAVTNRLDTLRPLLPELLNRLDRLDRRTPVTVGERQSGESV